MCICALTGKFSWFEIRTIHLSIPDWNCSWVNKLKFLHTKKWNYKTNNIIWSSTGWEPWRLIKCGSDPFHNTRLKNLSFHTHVSCKSYHIVWFIAIKSSCFACQCYYNIWHLACPQLFFFICSLFLNIGIFIFLK